MGKKTKGVNNRQSGGIDFIRAKKKVGKKIKKQANVTDTTVRAKRINLPGQTVGTEGKGEALTNRGLSMSELLNQTSHYSEKVRKDALEGMRELLEAHPETMKGSAAAVVEKTAERLVDREQIVRVAARAALKHGVLPALGKRGTAPFAKRLVLHVGAALTHVDPVTRRDAPAALETLLDFAPELVAAHAPAATLRHLADLLRRGDDAASSALDASASASATAAAAAASARRRAERYGLSPTFGDMTASRVGAAKPGARLKVLTACRRFLETLVAVSDASEGFGARGGGESRTATRFLPRFKRARDDDDERFDGAEESDAEKGKSLLSAATHAFRLARPPVDAATAALDAFGGGRASRAAAAERDDGAAGVPAAAADLAALLFSAWDEATPALRDASGGGADAQHVDFLVKTRCMTEALVCTRLALRLVDRADAGKRGGVAGAAAGAAAGAVAKRVLDGGAFPAAAPAAHGAPERRALVAYNAAAAALLSATADGVAAVLDARREARAVFSGDAATAATEGDEDDASTRSDDSEDSEDSEDVVDARAADAASASVAEYLAGALRGVALDAGACGEAERTAEGDYGELLRAARRALLRAPSVSPARSSPARRARAARVELVDAVGEVWSRAVVAGPPERRAACVSLLAAALPSAYALPGVSAEKDGPSAPSSARSGGLNESAAAKWLRPFARALWELKHRDPATTTKMLVALRTVASRATETQAPATHEALVAVESELAPFFALAPPPSADPDAPRAQAKLGPFARLPARAQNEAVALLGCLPALSPATVRAVAHAALAPRSATEPLLRKEKERHLHEREGRREDEELLDDVATRAVDAVAANVAAAPLALSTSFFAAVLTGAPEWDRAERVAGAAARALVDLGDADAWAGAALAWGAVATARRRARASSKNQRGAEGRAVFGALRLAAAAAEASSHETDTTGNVVEKLAPRDLEEDVPTLLASALTFARERGDTTKAKPFRGDESSDADATSAARSALDGVAARALHAAPRWAAGTFAALAIGVSVETRSVDGNETDAVEAAALAASFVARTHLKRARASEPWGDGSLTTLSFEAQTSRLKESALKCVSALRDAADALVRLGVAGAARAASAARDAARDVQDAFP
jgi:pre-rRNA-processing protein IPI1